MMRLHHLALLSSLLSCDASFVGAPATGVQHQLCRRAERSAAAVCRSDPGLSAAIARQAVRTASSVALVAGLALGTSLPLLAAEAESTAGFEEFAEKGGVMKTDPMCFFKDCAVPTQACFTNPSCLKGITCLGNCRGEQLCATQCFARFGSEKLNTWLGCAPA